MTPEEPWVSKGREISEQPPILIGSETASILVHDGSEICPDSEMGHLLTA